MDWRIKSVTFCLLIRNKSCIHPIMSQISSHLRACHEVSPVDELDLLSFEGLKHSLIVIAHTEQFMYSLQLLLFFISAPPKND